VVLVYARAMDGSPAPLAIVRRRVKELPLRLWLDDSMAMVEGLSLAGFEAVEVVARMAAPQSGDLQGRVGPVKAGDAVRVVIDEVVP
jgi:cytochrome c-type biogenesis protein CcmH